MASTGPGEADAPWQRVWSVVHDKVSARNKRHVGVSVGFAIVYTRSTPCPIGCLAYGMISWICMSQGGWFDSIKDIDYLST